MMKCLRIVLIAACLSVSWSALAAERPNFVMIMADDLGWGDVGYNGHPHLKTPHLDAMAKAGLRLNRFYSAAPVCSPTRGSCITGRHPYRYGIPFANSGHMLPEELTLAELLAEHGYQTGHFGKWHLGTLTKTIKDANRGGPRGAKNYSPPWDNGFHTSFSTESKVPTWDPMLRPKTATGKHWWDPVEDQSEANQYGTFYWANGKRVEDNLLGDDSKLIMDRAVSFIRAASNKKKPFFTVIWFHAPHLPVVAGPKYAAMYSDFEKYTQHYYGCITALDEQVGRLRSELRDLGVDNNTMVCFCSDNGPEGSEKAPGSAKHLRGRKRSLFEGGVRVPGVIEWPEKIRSGSTTDVPATTSDYLPTILESIGAKMVNERPIDGISLLPLFAGKMKQRSLPIGFESSGQTALVDNRHKIVRLPQAVKARIDQKEPTSGYMLFDLIIDPSESHDIAKQHPKVVERMVTTLRAWRASCLASDRGDDYQ